MDNKKKEWYADIMYQLLYTNLSENNINGEFVMILPLN
jgi:hypothetical protein